MTLEMVTTAAAAAESSSSWKMQNDDEEEDAREVFEDETSHSISLRSNITKEENYLLLATDGDDEEERGSSSFTWTKQPDFLLEPTTAGFCGSCFDILLGLDSNNSSIHRGKQAAAATTTATR